MLLELYQRSFNGKQLFCGYLSGYTIYVNHKLVERLDKDAPQRQVSKIELPIENCDIIEIGKDILVLVPGDKVLYFFNKTKYDVISIECEDYKTYSNSTLSTLILAPGKVKLYCEYTDEAEDTGEEETKNMVILLYPNGRIEDIPDEKILEYV